MLKLILRSLHIEKFTFWNRRYLWTAILGVVFFLLSMAKVVVLPQGGALTYFSMLALWLAFFFLDTPGRKHPFLENLIVALIFGGLRFLATWLTGEYIEMHPVCILLEYPVACGAFALGQLVREPKEPLIPRLRRGQYVLGEPIPDEPWSLRGGYLVGVFCMFVIYVISAMLFYDWEYPTFFGNLAYSMLYDGSYLGIEAGVSLIVLAVPQVANAFYYLKYISCHEKPDPTLISF